MTFCLNPKDGSGYARVLLVVMYTSKYFSIRQFWQLYQCCVEYLHLTIVEIEMLKSCVLLTIVHLKKYQC